VFKKPASRIGLVSKILHRLHFQLDQSPWSYGLSVAYIAPPTRRSPLHHKAARTNESSRFLSACSGASDALITFGVPTGKQSPKSPRPCRGRRDKLGWRCAQHVTAVASLWVVACVLAQPDVTLRMMMRQPKTHGKHAVGQNGETMRFAKRRGREGRVKFVSTRTASVTSALDSTCAVPNFILLRRSRCLKMSATYLKVVYRRLTIGWNVGLSPAHASRLTSKKA
jgi:hypothetical protein